MRVAVLAHPRHPIAPPFMGGMESHAWHLTRGLAARGHDVTLFAAGDSDGGVPLHPVCPVHYDAGWPGADWHGSDALNAHVDGLWAAALPAIRDGGFDVVHNNTLHRYPPRLARAARVPMVTSLHVPPFDTLRRAVHDAPAPWHLTTVTSRVQMARWWDAPPPSARVLHNGIDLADWPFARQGGGGAVWAGRITPNKGTALAARAARIAGVPLTIFGSVEDPGYFAAEVAPLLGGDVRHGGHLPGAALAAEMGRADVLMFTPMWDEPFGLTAIEAMACGLPVAAFGAGAVREVVGPCGAFAPMGDAPALAAAIGAASALPRAACRARVEARFTLGRMLDGCEALYAEAAGAREADWPEISFSARELAIAPRRGWP